MITDAILDFLEAGVKWMISLFPNGGQITFIEHWQTILKNLGAINYFLPISETFAFVVAVLFVFPFFAGVSLSLWIVAQLRGSAPR